MEPPLEVILVKSSGGTAVVRRLDPVRCLVTNSRVRLAARVELAEGGVGYEVLDNDGLKSLGVRTYEQLRAY